MLNLIIKLSNYDSETSGATGHRLKQLSGLLGLWPSPPTWEILGWLIAVLRVPLEKVITRRHPF